MLTTNQAATQLDISVRAVNKAVQEGRLQPVSRGQQYGSQRATNLIAEEELERFAKLIGTNYQPRSSSQAPPTYVPDALPLPSNEWRNRESFPEGTAIHFWGTTDKYVPLEPHPVEGYLRMGISQAHCRSSMTDWMKRLDLGEDWYQEAWAASIEAYRMGLSDTDTYNLVGRRLASLERRSGIRRVRGCKVREEVLADEMS